MEEEEEEEEEKKEEEDEEESVKEKGARDGHVHLPVMTLQQHQCLHLCNQGMGEGFLSVCGLDK